MPTVITGAAGGIGKAAVTRFLAEDHDVLVVDVNKEGLRASPHPSGSFAPARPPT